MYTTLKQTTTPTDYYNKFLDATWHKGIYLDGLSHLAEDPTDYTQMLDLVVAYLNAVQDNQHTLSAYYDSTLYGFDMNEAVPDKIRNQVLYFELRSLEKNILGNILVNFKFVS